ncbi:MULTISPECIES: hypothetical protein [Bacillus]|uniref:hypothetical protein n=1 Tax=Bacillus TaxID=1386 RepID=UPI0021114415|nr:MULTISPECIES: hypothetical protein [Bacillus]MED1749582.1 hypothetical protein [Bacillus zhangzhouensis]UUD43979.1 hypothetical protein NPA43_06945 [Bacillus pumilus]
MTDKEKQAIFQDLFELYQEGELGEEAASWMKRHEQQFQHSFIGNDQSSALTEDQNDDNELKRMKGFIYSLYLFFIVLSIWMTVWFYF